MIEMQAAASLSPGREGPYLWRTKVWTPSQAERLWPSASALIAGSQNQLPAELLGDLSAKTADLGKGAQYEIDAYECVRWARWAEENGEVCVKCPACGQKGWSYSAKKPQRRWRCVTKQMYEKQEKIEGKPSRHTRIGCKLQFNDTKMTPLEKVMVPVGIIFWALYVPHDLLVQQLRELGDKTNADELSEVLKGLGKDEDLAFWDRMRQLARVFCGRILLEDYPALVSHQGRVQLLEDLARHSESLCQVRHEAQQVMDQAVRKSVGRYKAIYSQLGILQRLDTDRARGRDVDHEQRKEAAQELKRMLEHVLALGCLDPALSGEGRDEGQAGQVILKAVA